jgi:hypothetical protein
LRLLECTTDKATPAWTTFKIDPGDVDAAHLLSQIRAAIPEVHLGDSGLVKGVLHFTVLASYAKGEMDVNLGLWPCELEGLVGFIREALGRK